MEEMAAMLNSYAGGLQQSFTSVFERVGDSLAQSEHMMRMMNEVMEAALLQSLRVTHRVDASDGSVRFSLLNASQIHVAALSLAVQLDGSEDDAVRVELEALAPGDQREVRVPLEANGVVSGMVRLSLQSPGTQQPLEKSVPFRVSLFDLAVFEPVRSDAIDLSALAVVESNKVTLEALRQVLRLSPLDAMMTVDQGCYRMAGGFEQLYVLVKRDPASTPPFRVAVAFNPANSSNVSELEAQSKLMLDDLEALSIRTE